MFFAVVVGAVVLTSTDGAQFPTVKNPPQWSWTSLGAMAFAHTGEPHAYTATDLLLLKKFSMVQFDKKQNVATLPDACQEDRFIAAARQVKAANPKAQVLMYLNGLINFPDFQHLYNATVADPSLLLHDSNGKIVRLGPSKNTVFDVRNAGMRKIFVDAALYGMTSGAFNGVFIDRANWAQGCVAKGGGGGVWSVELCSSLINSQRTLLEELMTAVGLGGITLAKETSGVVAADWEVVNGVMTSDTFCSQYCHKCNDSVSPATLWTTSDAQNCANSIATIANMSARGQLTQSHAMGPFQGPLGDQSRQFTIAAFLVAAGNLSFFTYANWAIDCWELTGTRWWPEYDFPLGVPTSPANTKIAGSRWKYSRNFSSGTTVYVDVATRETSIHWRTSTPV
eukprot:m.145982 g.145982  ORF g.145982 m.145982 type:complete len:396 (-) comp17754_c0_seq1:33-1220(-)